MVHLRNVIALGFLVGIALACARRHGSLLPEASSLTDADRQLIVGSFAQLLPLATAPVPICVQLADGTARYAPDAQLLAALGSRARAERDCPPTYSAMMVEPNAVPRPRGYVDPYRIVAWRPTRSATAAVVRVQLWQGTSFNIYECTTVIGLAQFKPVCKHTGEGVS